MNQKQFTDSMAYLGLAFGKEYTSNELAQYYDFLKEYNDATLTAAIKNLIVKSKFLPKIADLIDECDNCKVQIRFDIINFMINQGYFHDDTEIAKAEKWLETNIIPGWFKPILNEYYTKMSSPKLEQKEAMLIGG